MTDRIDLRLQDNFYESSSSCRTPRATVDQFNVSKGEQAKEYLGERSKTSRSDIGLGMYNVSRKFQVKKFVFDR